MPCKNNIKFTQSSLITIPIDSIVFNVCSKHCIKNVELEQFIIIDTATSIVLCTPPPKKNPTQPNPKEPSNGTKVDLIPIPVVCLQSDGPKTTKRPVCIYFWTYLILNNLHNMGPAKSEILDPSSILWSSSRRPNSRNTASESSAPYFGSVDRGCKRYQMSEVRS